MDESIGFRHRKKYRTCNSQINPGENKSIYKNASNARNILCVIFLKSLDYTFILKC